MERAHKVLQGFFWLAFAAFLSASIPHIAYFFRAYEPQADGKDTLWWVVSFSIAVSIDITIFLLSMTVAGMQRQRKSGGLIFSVWVFIIGLAALSWYINFKYAERFINTDMISPTFVSLPYVGMIGDINPLIASAFQALAIAYTWIADKIAADETPKTAKELKAEADELEQAAKEKQRIAIVKRGGKVSSLTGFIDGVIGVAKHARDATQNALLSQVEDTAITEQGATPNARENAPGYATPNATLSASDTQHQTQEKHTDKLARITEQGATPDTEQNAGMSESITETDATKTDVLDGATSQRSVTIKEASLLLNLSESYTRTLVNNGKLRNTPRNKKRVLKSSIDAYNAMRKDTGKEEAITPRKTPLIVAPDEQVNTAQNESIVLSLIERRMYDVLAENADELTALLHLADEQGIEELTETLRTRYPQYAGYVTEKRVSTVLAYAREHNHAVSPATNGHKDIGITEELVPLSIGG